MRTPRQHFQPVQLDFYSDLLLATRHSRCSLIIGDPGSGKSTAAIWTCRELGNEPVVIQGTSNLELSSIWGQYGLRDGNTSFVDRGISLALKNNRFVVIDDFMTIPAEIRSELLQCRDAATVTNPISGEIIPIDPSWRIIATSLPEDMRCRGNSAVVKSLMDGFIVTEIPPLTRSEAQQVLKNNYPAASEAMIEAVLDRFEQFRRMKPLGSEEPDEYALSVRAAAHTLELLLGGMAFEKACRLALVGKWSFDSDLFAAAKTLADASL